MGSFDLFGFLPFGLLDLIDILLVAILLFKLYELIKGTIAMRIFMGVLSIYLLWLLVTALQMELMGQIFRQFINVGMIALIIVFQQEIRRFLLAIGNVGLFRQITGNQGIWSWLGKDNGTKITLNIHALGEAVYQLSSQKCGALIVIEREADLQGVIDNGRKINADISAAMIETIFFKNNPLHDGAMVIRGNKIAAASCVLPVASKHGRADYKGMRHKAAKGMSQESDAIVIAVSEENGKVSVYCDNRHREFDDKLAFRNEIQSLLAA